MYCPSTPESIRRSTESNDELAKSVPNLSLDGIQNLGDKSLPPVLQQGLHQGTELDFDLIWPDSEDLFQTIMSTDTTHQFQMPVGALPFSVSASPAPSDLAFATPTSFDERPSSIGAIPSGGNTQAVQDVSKMVSNLVGAMK